MICLLIIYYTALVLQTVACEEGFERLVVAVIRSSAISDGWTRVGGMLTQQEPVSPTVCAVTRDQLVSCLTLGSDFDLMLLLGMYAFFLSFFFFFLKAANFLVENEYWED